MAQNLSHHMWFSRGKLCLVLGLIAVCTCASAGLSMAAVDISRLAIFPFVNADVPSSETESIAGLGTMLASRLTTLFAVECPQFRVVAQAAIEEVIRQQGMSDMGLIQASRIPEIGAIADADHFWTGTYRQSGSGITVDAILWSVEEAAAARAVDVQLRWFFPSRAGHVEALACQLFSAMHREIFLLPSPVACPGVSLLGELAIVARAGAGSVGMGSLNNVIRQAGTLYGISMAEINMMPGVSGGVGYVVIPDLFTMFAEVEYLWASRHAGSSANVSLDCIALIPQLGLEWRMDPPWETDSQLLLRGSIGWASATMTKRDVQGVLDCPASVLGSGLAYEISGGMGFPIGEAATIQLEASYRGCRVSSTSIRLPSFDFSGVMLRLSLIWTFGGAG